MPFDQAPKPMKLDALGTMLEGAEPPAEDEPGALVCQACNAAIDPQTGEPVEPVTDENVAYLQDYVDSQTGS